MYLNQKQIQYRQRAEGGLYQSGVQENLSNFELLVLMSSPILVSLQPDFMLIKPHLKVMIARLHLGSYKQLCKCNNPIYSIVTLSIAALQPFVGTGPYIFFK